jgi:hypothetical protein
MLWAFILPSFSVAFISEWERLVDFIDYSPTCLALIPRNLKSYFIYLFMMENNSYIHTVWYIKKMFITEQ